MCFSFKVLSAVGTPIILVWLDFPGQRFCCIQPTAPFGENSVCIVSDVDFL